METFCETKVKFILSFQKGSQEYIDATDLLDLYYEIRDELLVETFGETKADFEEDDEEEEEVEDEEEEEIQEEVQQQEPQVEETASQVCGFSLLSC